MLLGGKLTAPLVFSCLALFAMLWFAVTPAGAAPVISSPLTSSVVAVPVVSFKAEPGDGFVVRAPLSQTVEALVERIQALANARAESSGVRSSV